MTTPLERFTRQWAAAETPDERLAVWREALQHAAQEATATITGEAPRMSKVRIVQNGVEIASIDGPGIIRIETAPREPQNPPELTLAQAVAELRMQGTLIEVWSVESDRLVNSRPDYGFLIGVVHRLRRLEAYFGSGAVLPSSPENG